MPVFDPEEKFLPFTFGPKTGPIKRTTIYTKKSDAIPGWDYTTWLRNALPILGTDRHLQLKGRALAER